MGPRPHESSKHFRLKHERAICFFKAIAMLVQYLKLTYIDEVLTSQNHIGFPTRWISRDICQRSWVIPRVKSDAPKVPFWAQTCFFFRWERAPKKKGDGCIFWEPAQSSKMSQSFNPTFVGWWKLSISLQTYWLVAWWNVYVGYRIGILNMTKSFRLTVVSKFEPPVFVTYSWKSWAVT